MSSELFCRRKPSILSVTKCIQFYSLKAPSQVWDNFWVEFISGIIVLCSLFIMNAKLRNIEIYWNQLAYHLLLPHIKLFKKTQRGLELVSLPQFLNNFWRRILLLLYFINWPNFIVYCLYSWDIWQLVYCNCLLTRMRCHKFWN